MIDVVFLLLVFFVWTSSFETPEFDLPSSIARPPSAGVQASSEAPPVEIFDEIIIRIEGTASEPKLTMNQETFDSRNELGVKLSKIIELGVSPPVIVHPDPEIPMAIAIAVYDTARSAGADRVLFAARAD